MSHSPSDKQSPSLPGTELYGDRYFSGPYSTAQFTKEEDDLYERVRANLPAVLAALSAPSHVAPIEMLLFCPRCQMQHVDAPEPEKGWTNPPHATHTCKGCGLNWRPSNALTNGVSGLSSTEQKHVERFMATDPRMFASSATATITEEALTLAAELRGIADMRGGPLSNNLDARMKVRRAADLISRTDGSHDKP